MIGGEIGRPGVELDRARDGDPDPPQAAREVGRRARAADRTARSTRSRPTSGPASIRQQARRDGRGSGRQGSSARRPMLVAPRSATRRWPASARNVSWRGGGRRCDGPRSPSDDEAPRSMSSPTRWATMARPSPVRATSSDRDRDRPRRISSSTRTRASRASSASGRVHRPDDRRCPPAEARMTAYAT